MSCGRGEILAALVRDGCSARGTHYRSDDYKLASQSGPIQTAGLSIDPDVDLVEPLPYSSESFDLVILSEVLEHLPNHETVVVRTRPANATSSAGWSIPRCSAASSSC